MTATTALAEFAAGLRHVDLPSTVVDRLLLHTLDQIGAALVGAARPYAATVRAYALEETPDGPCTVYGTRRTARPEWAALANGTAGHGFEIDDYALPALAHPGCVVVPTALAVAEATGARGHAVLAALAAGFETVTRFGLATTPSLTSDRGFHVTGVHGVFGAAAVAGSLYGLDPPTLASAYGLAASQAGGLTEYTRSGGEVKRLHAGLAAMAGIRSARLAVAGFTGPATVVEGPRGFLRAFVARPRGDRLTAGLGAEWRLDGLSVKRFCVCAGLHAPVLAVAALRDNGLRADEVTELVVGLDRATLAHVGAVGPRPRDMTGAQFSAHHAVAMRLVLGGNDVADYTRLEEAGFDLPAVAALAGRVRLEVDAEADAAFPDRLLASVTAVLRDGTTVTRRAEVDPLPPAEIEAKFRRIAGAAVGADIAEAVREAVFALCDDAPAGAVLAPLREVTAWR